ncbi:EAL domain-containing protein [Rhizobium sp. RU20A]|uniref:putative bifunctional diguanylate cyclase/phosphodiesterase n=1 Tax=Rhizobium sp. RU20A TaxID=1907412 RepID=UPI001FCE47B7|nr:EAL domain-containing protein [Rhizobium sp. RU20A]
MDDFIRSSAGRQVILLGCAAALASMIAYMLRFELDAQLRANDGPGVTVFLAVVNIVGLASFIYAGLRVRDFRNEALRRRQAAERANHIATHDHLTRLPNRYALERFDVTGMAGPNAEMTIGKVTVFAIDLDGFKKVNDLAGHRGGDLLLVEIARRLSAFTQRGCIFRLGGDEFLAVASGLPPEKEEKFASMLIHALTRPVQAGDMMVQVGASVGYARWPEHATAFAEVCHLADVALYEAKKHGPNRTMLFERGMLERVSARARLENRLRRAVEDDRITCHYQPLIDLKTGDICGFEALARWQDESGTMISPQLFISLAEEIGLITPLFEQLLAKACREAAGWPDTIRLSFNLSPLQLEDRMLVERIGKILQVTGLDPARLEMEITENALMTEPELAETLIRGFRLLGIQVSLDDFGTGYSSLAQLARFQFDKIKLDKSLVPKNLAEGREAKIVKAMLGLGKSLNVAMTIEGLEEHSQLAYFLAEGCDIGQGYLFGRPMPAEAALAYIAERQHTRDVA